MVIFKQVFLLPLLFTWATSLQDGPTDLHLLVFIAPQLSFLLHSIR